MKARPFQALHDGIPVHRAHAAREQDRLGVRREQAFRFSRSRHSVGEHDDRPSFFAHETASGVGQRLGELPARVLCGNPRSLPQRGGLAGQLASAKRMMRIAPLPGVVPENVAGVRRRRSGHHDRMEAAAKRRFRPAPILPDRAQCLEKRLRAMRFVQEDEAVVGNESCVYRPCSGAPSVGAKQQARTDLIDGGCHDGRLQRVPRPGFRAVHSAAQ